MLIWCFCEPQDITFYSHDKGYRAESYQNLINGLFENPEVLDITGLSDFFNLLPLAPCKSILNAFVYEIYQRVFILLELSVKHMLSDFLLPKCCHKYSILIIAKLILFPMGIA